MRKPLKIKVCGMRDAANVAGVAALGVDFLGFIFYSGSLRFVGPHFRLPVLPGSVRPVGVFVNEPVEYVHRMAARLGLQYVQLHGHESVAECARLQSLGLTVIKTVHVATGDDVKKAAEYSDSVAYLLFDTKSARLGGSGVPFDWELLSGYGGQKPYFLSGGLSLANLEAALSLARRDNRLYALDFNSGLEASPGLKDLEKTEHVMKTITGYALHS